MDMAFSKKTFKMVSSGRGFF